MELDKMKNFTDAELKIQEAQTGEQLFRLRFQKSLGNAEGTKKLRELRKDVARIKTLARQRELGHAVAPTESTGPVKKLRKAKKD